MSELPKHDQWFVCPRLYAEIGRAPEAEAPASKVGGVEIVPSVYMPDDQIALMYRGKFVGIIVLERPYNVEKALVEAFEGRRPIVWS